MRLVVLTQVVDADHPALAQTVDILEALSRRCEEVVVVCDVQGYTVPAHVPGPAGQVQPGSVAQVVEVEFKLQDLGVPAQVPPVGVFTRQPGTEGHVAIDKDAHDTYVGVPAQ